MNVGNFMEQSVSYDRRSAADVEETEDVGELRAAEYLVFLFALETYVGWLEETSQAIEGDPTLRKGISLAIQAEKQIQLVQEAIRKDLSNPATQALLDAALRTPMTIRGFTVRALRLRIVLSKGGTATMKAIFGTSTKARREVQEAMEASSLSDPDAALKQLAAQPLKNQRMRAWIDLASDVVPPAAVVINAVQQAAKGATDASESILINRAQEESRPNSDASVAARDAQAKTLAQIEVQATETAKKALAQSGEEDRTLTKAEVIGVATATATAIASDPDKPQNIPPALRSLDPEQRAAAMTGGKVRVSAGAGSGKSTTLLARAQYLIDNGAVPNRMMAMSFNKKAADELATKMAVKIGSGKVSTSKNQNPAGVQVGTMHSTFLKFINQYGTPAQVNVFAKVNGKGGPVSASTVFKTVKDLWEECFPRFDKDPPGNPDPEAKTRTVPMQDLWKMPPKSNRMMSYMNYFQGQGWTAQQAREWAKTQTSMWTPPGKPVEDPSIEADQAAKFYEVYEGLKGSLGPGWRPNLCGKPSVKFQKFVDFYRAGKPRVGDFNDMLSIFRDILKTNPVARRGVQSHFDHIMIDECQDLNPLQFEIAQLMTEHIETDDPKRSFWMVGDDKQSIYGFRGSSPDHIMAFVEEWQAERVVMNKNYRSTDSVVRAANNVIRKAVTRLETDMQPMRGVEGTSHAVFAEDLDDEARKFTAWVIEGVETGSNQYSDYTCLFRTNAQSRAVEEALLSAKVPYVVVGGSSFYERKEVRDLLGYLRVASGRDETGENVRRCINAPFRYLGAKFVDRLQILAAGNKAIDWPTLVFRVAEQAGIQQRQRSSAVQWSELMGYLRELINNPPTESDDPCAPHLPEQVLKHILQVTGYQEWLEKEEGSEGLHNNPVSNVRELIRVASRFSSVGEFLKYIDKNIDESKKQRRDAQAGGNRVLLMSVHRSKGLEWPNVWVVGMNEGILPHARGDLEEERRLAYVAMTRARDNLRCSYVRTVVQGAAIRELPPSQFLIDSGLMSGSSVDGEVY